MFMVVHNINISVEVSLNTGAGMDACIRRAVMSDRSTKLWDFNLYKKKSSAVRRKRDGKDSFGGY